MRKNSSQGLKKVCSGLTAVAMSFLLLPSVVMADVNTVADTEIKTDAAAESFTVNDSEDDSQVLISPSDDSENKKENEKTENNDASNSFTVDDSKDQAAILISPASNSASNEKSGAVDAENNNANNENSLSNVSDAEESYVAWIGETGYTSLEAAVNAAESGATIQLGEGSYTLYNKGADVLNKNLTFVGAGSDKTTWLIGPTVPDPAKFGTEYNSDYSFDVRSTEAKETVTFQNMTLQSGSVNYLGFAGTDNTVVENCVISGKTFYWGYTSATFTNTTFDCPDGDYALWTYSSPVMTFNSCTFNTTNGKAINVYTDYGAGKNNITVNFNSCTVNATGKTKKTVLKINDSNMGSCKYIINISGKNTINGEVKRSALTCSRLFGFDEDSPSENSGRTDVSIDGTLVYQNAKILNHSVDTVNDKYTDGYKDNAFDITYGDWSAPLDGKISRSVHKVCQYCGYTEDSTETKAAVKYDTNGGTGSKDDSFHTEDEDVTISGSDGISKDGADFVEWNTKADGSGTSYKEGDQYKMTDSSVTLYAQWKDKTASTDTKKDDTQKTEDKTTPAATKYTVKYNGNGGDGTLDDVSAESGKEVTVLSNVFTRQGYTFTGWNTAKDGSGTAYAEGDALIVNSDVTLYAQWKKNATSAASSAKASSASAKTSSSKSSPKTGDQDMEFYLLLLLGAAAVTTVVYKKKRA